VRTFARQTPVDHDCIDAVEPLEAALILVSRQLELRGIEIARDIEPGLPKICGDFFKLQQIYLNFITNARDALAAVASGRRLTISAQRIGDAIDIALENNGPTIPEDVRPKLFDPFFTTKEPNEGTGLGLSISYGIAREHGGDIRHETPAGGGARFVLRLPVAPRQSSR
jgi:C4-dicarboxylate-specific signal transduction histidine kinase